MPRYARVVWDDIVEIIDRALGLVKMESSTGFNPWFKEDGIIRESDKLENLVDCFLIEHPNNTHELTISLELAKKEIQYSGVRVFGVIWCRTDNDTPMLKSVIELVNDDWLKCY